MKRYKNIKYSQQRRHLSCLRKDRDENKRHLASIIRIADALESTKTQEHVDDGSRSRREMASLILLLFTVIFAFGGDIIFYFTLTDAHDNAAAQLKASNNSMRIDQRAWLSIANVTPYPSVPTVDQPFNVVINFKNTGKTPALSVDIVAVGQAVLNESDRELSYERFHKIKNQYIPANGGGPIIVSPINSPNGKPRPVTAEIMNLLQKDNLTLFVHGHVDYKDVFGGAHWLNFCMKMAPPFNSGFVLCDDHNDSGDNQRKESD